MGETIDLRNGDPLHGGRAELLVSWQGGGIPASCPAVIRRGTTKDPFLGPRGWQTVEYEFHPSEAYEEPGRLVLRFGPELVDNVLRDDDILQISLPVLGIADVIAWSGITRSVTVSNVPRQQQRKPLKSVKQPLPTQADIALAAVADRPGWIAVTVTGEPRLSEGQQVAFHREDGAAPVLGPADWQASEHSFVPAGREAADGRTCLMLDLGAAASAVQAGQTVEVLLPGTTIRARTDWPVLQGPITSDPPSPGGRGWLLPVLALLVLAAIAVGGWWWSRQPDPMIVQDDTVIDLADEAATTADEVLDDSGSVADEDMAEDEDLAGDAVPVPIDPGQAAYDQALAAIAAGECPAARTGMLSAIDLGHAPALLAWAQRQDSLDFQPCLTETANDVSALEHYQRACAADAEGAADSLRALMAELERQADAGEGAAGDVLRLAVPKAREACGI